MMPDFLYDQTATIQDYLGFGLEGEKLGEPYELPCRVEMARKRVSMQTNTSGAVQEVVANALIFFPAGTRLEINAHVTVDDRTYTAVSISPKRAFFEESHVEVIVL